MIDSRRSTTGEHHDLEITDTRPGHAGRPPMLQRQLRTERQERWAQEV